MRFWALLKIAFLGMAKGHRKIDFGAVWGGGVSQTPPRKWPLRLPEVVFEAGNQMHRIYEEISAPEMTGNGPEMDRKWVGNGEIERL